MSRYCPEAREPLGVIGIITPWNFPIAIPAWKIAAALAYGNCVVFKPAGLTPASGRTLAELLQEHGCPPGVFNLVMGSGSVVGEAIAVANDTNYGLSAGICTKSLKFSQEFKKRSEAGVVMVNLPTAGIDYHVAFGGTKGSSYGPREQGRYAVEFYTQVKTAYTAY